MHDVKDSAEVHRLFCRERWSKTAIADQLDMSRNTVDRLLSLERPPHYVRSRRGSALDAFHDDIVEMLAENPKAAATVIAKVLSLSRQSLSVTPQVPRTDTSEGVPLRLVAPVIPDKWATTEIGPGIVEPDVAICTMARRHLAAGYRKVTSRLRRLGYVVNHKRVARLLRAWGFTRTQPKPHPKAEGRPFRVSRPNELWQTDMTLD